MLNKKQHSSLRNKAIFVIISLTQILSLSGWSQAQSQPRPLNFQSPEHNIISPQVAVDFDAERLATVEVRTSSVRIGSGVLLGKFDFKYTQADNQKVNLQEVSVVATNFHVNGPFSNTNIYFISKGKILRFSSEYAYCSIIRDLCLLTIHPQSVDSEEKQTFLSKPNLTLRSSNELIDGEKIIFIGRKKLVTYFSEGQLDRKFEDSEGYFDKNHTIVVGMSKSAKLDQGMSGGATIGSQGELLGINSFFTPASTQQDNVAKSFFLPTDWILEIMKNPMEHDLRFYPEKLHSQAPFWVNGTEDSAHQMPRFLKEIVMSGRVP